MSSCTWIDWRAGLRKRPVDFETFECLQVHGALTQPRSPGTAAMFSSHDRRSFLRNACCGFGGIALAALLAEEGKLFADADPNPDPLAPRKPHFPAKAQRVIFLFMSGGPSHVDTFDPKPELTRLHGEKLPASFGPVKTRRGVDKNKLLASKRTFRTYGKSGIEVSDWFPHLGECVDDL